MLTQALTICAVVVLTYVFLQMLGPRPASLFIPLQEREKWSALLDSRLGRLLYIANLTATLTSLATVFIFFIGSSALFGHFIYVSIASVILGAFITVRLTAALASSEQFKNRLQGQGVSTLAIASLFWADSDAGRRTSSIARLITLVSIGCILWLEFATFSALAGALFDLKSAHSQALLMFFSVLFIFDFTLRNGLRGFIFTDLLHAPLILIGSFGVLYGAILLLSKSGAVPLNLLVEAPRLPLPETLVFVVATIFLNSFILLTGEPHWIRVWAMGSQVRKSTLAASSMMAMMWLLLIAVGLMISSRYASVGEATVVELVKDLGGLHPIFYVAFWMAATAALFSTADTQAYSFLLVAAFDPKEGAIRKESAIARHPFLSATICAALFALVLYLVKTFKLPFEQIVFFTFPLFLCLVPGMIQILRGGKPSPWPMRVSLTGYFLCGLGMVLLPAQSFFFSLGAPLVPALVSVGVWLQRGGAKNANE